MKNKKWLIILVSIVLIVNIAFYVAVNLIKVDEIVRQKISAYLTEILNAKVQIGEFSFNDRQINISDCVIQENNDFYDLTIKHIYVEMNLLKLLFSRFKNFKAIKHIQIYEPDINIKIHNKPSGKTDKKNNFALPDLKKYFQLLHIYKGKISIKFFSENINFSENIFDLALEISNKHNSLIDLTASNQKSGKIKVYAELKNQKISHGIIEWKNYSPDSLQFSFCKNINTNLNLNIIMKNNKINYFGDIFDVDLEFFTLVSHIPKAQFQGDANEFKLNTTESYLNENLVSGGLVINSPFSKNSTIKGKFHSDKIAIHSFYKLIKGFGEADLNIEGKLFDPQITGEAFSKELQIVEQKFNDTKVDIALLKKSLKIELVQSYWEKQKILGSGYFYFNKIFEFDIFSNNLNWSRNNINLQGNLKGNINYNKKLIINADLTDIIVQGNSFHLKDISCEAVLEKMDYSIKLKRSKKDIFIDWHGNLKDKTLFSQIKFKRFDLDDFLKSFSLPLLSGTIDFSANPDSIAAIASLRLFDKAFGKLDGRFAIELLLDKLHDHSKFVLETYNAKFNYEDLKISLLAEGTADSLHSKYFKINDNVEINSWLCRKPEFAFGIIAKGNKVKLRDYVKYFTNYYTTQKINGNANFVFEYNSRNNGNLTGMMNINRFHYADLQEIEADLQFYGNNNSLNIKKLSFSKNGENFLNVKSDIILKPELDITAIGEIEEFDLMKILPENKYQGIFNGNFIFSHKKGKNIADLKLKSDKCNFGGVKIDSLILICSQKDKLLNIVDFRVNRKNKFSFTSSGSIGYNLWNSKSFADPNLLNISFKGDLINVLTKQLDFIVEGKSVCEMQLAVSMQENGLFVTKGNFSLKNAEMQLKDQLEKLDKINIEMQIEKNLLKIDKFKMRLGEGRIYLSQKIDNDKKDFCLGSIKLGKFYIHTNDKGLLLNMPGFIPNNSVVKVVVKGRYEEDLFVCGPFDDIHISGDLYFSNGNVTYPPNTDNIIKLFGPNTTKKEKTVLEEEENILFDLDEEIDYPFDLDLKLHVEENLYYVTYPTNLLVKEGSYLHFLYRDGEFQVPDAVFNCEEGSVDMFGTQLILDFAQVKINPYVNGFFLKGTFYKKAADGTLITLTVFNDRMADNSNSTLQFRLTSDDHEDGMLDMLAKLRYNRSVDEISNQQKKTLLQDEVIQLAGFGIETAILDPLIHPLENWIRKLFRLDLFQIQTGIIKNFFDRYYLEKEDERNYLSNEELDNTTRFGSDMFLNNLSISMGKYASRKLFFNFETQFQKPEGVAVSSKLGIYNFFTIRYDLPRKYKLAYRYKILPFDEKNSHEIAIEKSFRFW